MSMPRPFSPQWGSNQVVVLGAGANSPRVVTADCTVIRVYNSGTGDLYVRGYNSLQTVPIASAADYPVAPGTDRLLFVGDLVDRVSLFSVAGTTAQLMAGDGGVS